MTLHPEIDSSRYKSAKKDVRNEKPDRANNLFTICPVILLVRKPHLLPIHPALMLSLHEVIFNQPRSQLRSFSVVSADIFRGRNRALIAMTKCELKCLLRLIWIGFRGHLLSQPFYSGVNSWQR